MFLLNATKSCLTLLAGEMLVAGSVNVHDVKFEFSDDWSDLVKTVTFRTVSDSRSVILDDEGECVIPWEVLKDSSPYLYVGLIGTRDAEVVLPTIWADLGEVRNGTKPGEDVTDPTPTVYEQVLSELGSRANNLNVKDEKLQLRSGETVLSEVELPKQSGSGTTDHSALLNRGAADQHPMSAITGLEEALKEAGADSWEDIGTKQAFEPIYWNGIPDGMESITVDGIEFYKIAEATIPAVGYDGASVDMRSVPLMSPLQLALEVAGGALFVSSYDVVNGDELTPCTLYVTVVDGENELDAHTGLYCSGLYIGGKFFRGANVSFSKEVTVPLQEQYLPTTVPVIPTAQIGQTIVVKAVDESGKPTEWEAADLGGAAIIDVVELPTEDIEEDSFYRLLTGTFVYNGYTQNGWICYCVESLPEVGEPVTPDMVNVTAYYSVFDSEVYGYIDGNLSAATGVPVGWYILATLGPSFGVAWGGFITDILDDPVDNKTRLLLEYVVWQYKNGKWTSLKSIGWVGDGSGAEVFNLAWNKAYGNASHAEGRGTVAGEEDVESYGAHAEGWDTKALGSASHAEGYGTTAKGEYSHAEGVDTTAIGHHQHVQGMYNIPDAESKYAHIVGNGKYGNHANAHTLDWSGLGWFAGGLKVGGTGQDDEASRTVMVNGDTQIVLTSPNGTKFAITVSDDGTLTATAQ